MNIPDHISESLEKFFWVKILKFFDAVSGMEKIRIRDPRGDKSGSATLHVAWEYSVWRLQQYIASVRL
jgi:hypothetical protein